MTLGHLFFGADILQPTRENSKSTLKGKETEHILYWAVFGATFTAQ